MELMNNKEKQRQSPKPNPNMAGIVNRNIKALVARRGKDENNKPVEERIADSLKLLLKPTEAL